jgi:serine/threonine-protein kinase
MIDLVIRLQNALGKRYSIEREIGSGGAGIVFLAEDVKHARKVALKVLRPEIGQSIGAERFLQEIRIAAQLSHPNILSLIDSGEEDGLLYYVMFYVAGESLRDRLIREKQLPVMEAVRLAREAAEALGHAHSAGVIHRDVKPENLLIEAGHALVCDFGIARAIGEAGRGGLTQTGLAIGTPAYMSPEQATAEEVDTRSDIYSLGCVLYEMLAGSPPYYAATPQGILARKAVEPLPDVRVVRDTVPDHVEAALRGALGKVPADRFSTAEEFARALEGDQDALPPSLGSQASPGWGRRLALIGGTAAVVAAGMLGFFAMRKSAPPASLRTTFDQLTAQPGVEDSPSLSPDGMWVVYAGEGTGHRDIFLRSVGGQLPINLTENSGAEDHSPAFSPSGEQIAFRSDRQGGGLFIMGRTGEAVRRVTSAGFNPAWSPDETRLVYATEHVGLFPLNWEGRSEIWITDVATGETQRINDGDAVQPTWSPDGRWIAFTARMGNRTQMDIWIMSADGGESSTVTSDIPTDWSPTWSPDGGYIYFSSDRGGSMNLWRIPMDQSRGLPTGEAEPVTTPATFVAHPTISGDGRSVAYSHVLMTQNIEKATLDPSTGLMSDPVPLTSGSRQWSSPDPSPDGTSVAFYSRDLPEGDLYIIREDGTGLRMVTGDSAMDRVPRWSPDGTHLAYFSNRSGELELWVIGADGSGNEKLTNASSSWGAWAPDGSRIAVNGISDAKSGQPWVFLFDPARAWEEQEVEVLPPADSSMAPFRVNDWSPDGRRLAGMTSTSDLGVLVHDLVSGSYERLTDFGQWPVWLADSRHLLFVSGGSTFYLIDSQSKEIRQLFSGVRDTYGPPRVTRDGRGVVFSRRVTEGDIWLVSLR